MSKLSEFRVRENWTISVRLHNQVVNCGFHHSFANHYEQFAVLTIEALTKIETFKKAQILTSAIDIVNSDDDMGNHAIRKIAPDATVTTLAGMSGLGNKDGSGNEAMFHYPTDIVIDQNGIIYITDSGNSTVRKLEYK